MFTGLIQAKGKVVGVERKPGGALLLTVNSRDVSEKVAVGESVAVSGVCLTVVSVDPPRMTFDIVRETVERSTLGMVNMGESVNLEQALKLGDRLGGHLVLGHVDGIGTIRDIQGASDSIMFRFDAPPEVMQYVVEKGSIAVDGISLTVADLGSAWFSVAVIPHTLQHTTLGEKSVGDNVNLETDIIGKYVYKFVGMTRGSDEHILKLLSEGGFLE